MKILHIINCLDKGGAERLLVDLLPFYKKRGIFVVVLALSGKKSHSDYIRMLKEQEIPCFSLSDGSVRNPLLISKMKFFLSKNHFDIIHVHLFPALYFASLACKTIKDKLALVYTEHSTYNKRADKPWLQPVEKFIYKSYDRIIAISPAVERRLLSWIQLPEKIEVIRNGVDISRFIRAESYDNVFFYNEFSIPENAIKLLMVARFYYPKDFETVVKMLAFMPEDTHLLLAGEGEDKEAIRHLVTTLNLDDRVHFLGFRVDVPSLMKSVDINILSSFYEGMSGVTLEALASGRVFLGSDVAGINDVVPDERFLFKAADPADLANKIKAIARDRALRDAMEEAAMEHVRKFDMGIMVQKHIALYTSLLHPNT